MKPSVVLKRAARLIEKGERNVGCCAIAQVTAGTPWLDRAKDDRSYQRAMEYFELMKPRNAGLYWFGSTDSSINQNRRVIALTLAAAIAEAEGQ